MNVFYLISVRSTRAKLRTGIGRADTLSTPALFSGSSLGVLSSLCASCTPTLGSFFVYLFGSGAGVGISSFLSIYQLPLRIVSIMILIWGYYSVSRQITNSFDTTASCRVLKDKILMSTSNMKETVYQFSSSNCYRRQFAIYAYSFFRQFHNTFMNS
ncbi:MAG: hypothetical protein DLM72_18840 [Candidatus Nitrosopolaris wilkensis]|nr:MAG: hypothetical protein DLM72_18840 [Candidatus Nitrosopolaris wilkensis]